MPTTPRTRFEIRNLFGKDLQTVKAFLNSFRKPGFIHPADRTIHARHTRSDNDFAVISIARNPYSVFPDELAGAEANVRTRVTADISAFRDS